MRVFSITGAHSFFLKLFLLDSHLTFRILGEKALLEFLQEEIESEKKSLAGHLPSQLENFQVKYDSAEVELSKETPNEK